MIMRKIKKWAKNRLTLFILKELNRWLDKLSALLSGSQRDDSSPSNRGRRYPLKLAITTVGIILLLWTLFFAGILAEAELIPLLHQIMSAISQSGITSN